MGIGIWLVGMGEGETKKGIKKNTCFSLWTNTSLIKKGNIGMDSGVQVNAGLFEKTSMERWLWFKDKTEKDEGSLQPSRDVTGLLLMPGDSAHSPGGILFFEFPASNPLGPAHQHSVEFILAKSLCINPFLFQIMFTLPCYKMNAMLLSTKCFYPKTIWKAM